MKLETDRVRAKVDNLRQELESRDETEKDAEESKSIVKSVTKKRAV